MQKTISYFGKAKALFASLLIAGVMVPSAAYAAGNTLRQTASGLQPEEHTWCHVALKKTDSDSNPIMQAYSGRAADGDQTGDTSWVGTEFTIYANTTDGDAHRFDNYDKGVSYSRGEPIETITVNEKGYAVTQVPLEGNTDYYIRETSTRDGYLPATDYTYPTYYFKTSAGDNEDDIRYTDAVSGRAIGNASAFSAWLNNENVQGSSFGVYANPPRHGGVRVKKYDRDRDNDFGHGDTDLSGAQFTIVNSSTYHAKNAAGAVDANGNNIGGRLIESAHLGNSPTYAQVLAAAGNCTMQVITTNRDGDAATGALDLPYGTYYIIETRAPMGPGPGRTSYRVNETWVGKVVVRTNRQMYNVTTVQGKEHDLYNHTYYGDAFDFAEDAWATRDQIYRSGIKIQKIDKELRDNIRQGIGSLENAEFTIVNASIYPVRNADGKDVATAKGRISDGSTWDDIKSLIARCERGETDNYIVQKIYTNKEGLASTGDFDLPYGTYYVIETKASYGYFIDKNFIGKIVVRDDGHVYTMGDRREDGTYVRSEATANGGYFIDLKDTTSDYSVTVDQQIRRNNFWFYKENEDSERKQYIPFLISAIRKDPETGEETVIESHAILANDYGYVNSASSYTRTRNGRVQTFSRKHSYNTNKLDDYVNKDTMLLDEEALIRDYGENWGAEVSTWGIYFMGNGILSGSAMAATGYVNDSYGALYPGFYRVTEISCKNNQSNEENLIASPFASGKEIYVYNYDGTSDGEEGSELYFPMSGNNDVMTPLAAPLNEAATYQDKEIHTLSESLDAESSTKTVPARRSVEVRDTIWYGHLTADHRYRVETQFVDLTHNSIPLVIIGTNDAECTISDDSLWVCKEFQPDQHNMCGDLNTTEAGVTVSALLNTKALCGHQILAIDYLYQDNDLTDKDNVDGAWTLVKIHPYSADAAYDYEGIIPGSSDDDYDAQVLAQSLYVPDLETHATDTITGDREGSKDKNDSIHDTVTVSNLWSGDDYAVVLKLRDTKTGEYVRDENGRDLYVVSGGHDLDSKANDEAPWGRTIELPNLPIDSSGFEGNKAVTVTAILYRKASGEIIGNPYLTEDPQALVIHDSLYDESETIRWADITTKAQDDNTADDVGQSRDDATIYDFATLHNIIFDDDDHDGKYTYKVTGHLVYQKDFTDLDGNEHKEGDIVDTLDGTKDTCTITSDASGNITALFEDGTAAQAEIVSRRYGKSVGKKVNGNTPWDNRYIDDPTSLICDVTVRMEYHVKSSILEGGTTVAYEYLYHDKDGVSAVEIARHEDITDKGQTIHYPHVETNAADNKTTDDVGAYTEEAAITDTVSLTNLVPGHHYIVKGILMDQETGDKFLVKGQTVEKTATIYVTKDGEITAGNGERVTTKSYNPDKNEVCGTVDLVFTFDAKGLEGRTCVVFEDLIHNGITVAVHNDILDKGQTVHFPKIRTEALDKDTADRVGQTNKQETVVDVVSYDNLVTGREYTISGILMNRKTCVPLTDAEGNQIEASRTFTAGEEEDGIAVSEKDEEKGMVSGTVSLSFTFDSSLLEGTTAVVFETLTHNRIDVAVHKDIHDKPQTIHYPKVRTSALEAVVGDEVGENNVTQAVDTVRFWNLIPGKEYTISGILMDRDTGKALLVDGREVTQSATITVAGDGSITAANGEKTTVTEADLDGESVSGTVDLTFNLDATNLENRTIVAFEQMFHNDVKAAFHEDLTDLAQTLHFPEVLTSASDSISGDNVGHVAEEETVIDEVIYKNLVIGRTYTIKGILMNQETGAPLMQQDGSFVTAEGTFRAGEESEVNHITTTYEEEKEVDGVYTLTFQFDSSLLKGSTVVVFENLYHNGIKVAAHNDINDENQSIHYPEVHTLASDTLTGDHVGTLWGELMNGARKDAGDSVPAAEREIFVDTVKLINLSPGKSYVVSGKLYDADESRIAEKPILLVIDGESVTKSATITVSVDGKTITGSNGEKTEVLYGSENRTDGTVELTFALDSSKIQGREIVAFEKLYHHFTYDENTTEAEEKDLITSHEDYTDKDQSVSEADIETTALDANTREHVGSVPAEASEYAVINDEVHMTKLVKGMEYQVKGVLADLTHSDPGAGRFLYLKTDGTTTEDREEAYTESITFTAASDTETHLLHFALRSDKVQGLSVTVFEDLYHNDQKVSSHPSGDEEGSYDKNQLKEQTVFYPTGKTNSTDNNTTVHSTLAGPRRTVTDRVYFENLLVGAEYTIRGDLVYQEDFTDEDGNTHKAGDIIVTREAVLSISESEDGADVTAQYANSVEAATVDSVAVHEYPSGDRAVSGYLNIEFTFDASLLKGATTVTEETFLYKEYPVFVHADLGDLPQTIRIPKISTTAAVDELDEAAVVDKDGNYKDITIVDTVTYENLWTQELLDSLARSARKIHYLDGTDKESDKDIFTVSETAEYILRGILMDKETKEPLKNDDGGIYEVYSEPFTPENENGSEDVSFTINAKDFTDGNGKTTLEGKTLVVFEDLYLAGSREEANNDNHVAEHHDITDAWQDIRLPKGKTHATDSIPEDKLAEPEDGADIHEALEALHDSETITTDHEAFAGENVTITDMVTFSNLHGNTKYTVTGTLMVVTEFDEDGNAIRWEEAKDDNGNAIKAEKEIDTSAYSADYNASVSGCTMLLFNFPGRNLAGKTTVAFEKIKRDKKTIFIHADINDTPQHIFLPKIGTHATEAYSGLDESIINADTIIIDRVTYQNLEFGKEYTLSATMHRREDGSEIKDTTVSGTFTAGTKNQYISSSGTSVMSREELEALFGKAGEHTVTWSDDLKPVLITADGTKELSGESEIPLPGEGKAEYESVGKTDPDVTGVIMNRCNGEVYLVIPVDTSRMEGKTIVAFETLYAKDKDDTPKVVAEHHDITDEEQDIKMPKIRTHAGLMYDSAEEGKLCINDHVIFENLAPGRQYILRGTLMNKADGTSTGYTAETMFIPTVTTGSVMITFSIDRDRWSGETLVAFEQLVALNEKGGGTITAIHEDITDADQSVPIPKIGTHAALDGNASDSGKGKISISDDVSYENLTAGQTYTLRGVLMNKSTKKATTMTAEAAFTPTEANGTQRITFTFDREESKGETYVVFERLTVTTQTGETTVAVHEDINDTAQTVLVPTIATKATAGGKSETAPGKNTRITDTVTYSGLESGRTYTLKGTLMDKKTGKPTPIKATKTFTPDSPDGKEEMTMTGDTVKYAGNSLVVFEQLYTKSPAGEEYIVATHEDIKDGAQTVKITKKTSTATPTTPEGTPPVNTGDYFRYGLAAILMIIGVILLGILIRRRRKTE